MPESKTRKAAATKRRATRAAETRQRRLRRQLEAVPGQHAWVPPLFITVGLLGAAWLVVFYIAGYDIPFMAAIGNWNMLIGLAAMGLAFVLATLWK